jgi:hypothetical protein
MGVDVGGGPTPYPHIALYAPAPRLTCSAPGFLPSPFGRLTWRNVYLNPDVARDRSHGGIPSLPAKLS